jgi:Ca-activated chloride channel family protein
VEQPFSTFAIDVDTAAYTLMRKHIQNGVLPPAEAVRTEEFVNFFDYDYRAPERQTFAVYTSLAPTPFGDGRLLKIGVKGKRLGREEQRPAVLTFVIDTSGSMDTPDRLGLVRRSLDLLIEELGEADQVAIVQVDSQARLILPPTTLGERNAIAAAIDGLQCSGSTHLEDGIKLGYEVAAQAFTGGSVNRVLLLSDGAANLGSADAEQILSMVESHRSQGIFCSVFGFGIGAYNDEILEQLANKGDGSYRFIDSQEEAKRVFVDELAATLHVIASDVKIQVEFYPEQVKTYRQLGYENRQLTKEQFRDDGVDAGEVGSGESVTALYELVAGVNTDQPLGVVRVRYRDAATGEVEEIAHPIRRSDAVASFEEASPQFRLAAAAAEFAEILRGSPFADGADYGAVADVLRPVALDLRLDQRVQELLQLVQRAPGLPRASGN